MRRRTFITLLGGAAAWPLAARAQQPTMPVIGWLSPGSQDVDVFRVTAFTQGLNEAAHIVARNVAIEYRWAENQNDRLPTLAVDLVRRAPDVIVAVGSAAAVAAKTATATVPIVFVTGFDPVALGLVASWSRPGGNVSGWTELMTELAPKQLEVLHELVPSATRVALLVNPANPNSENLLQEVNAAGRVRGMEVYVLYAKTEHDLDAVFTRLREMRIDALVIGVDALFNSRTQQLAKLAVQHALPTIHTIREFVAAGGLASYGSPLADVYRQVGVYTGRILKGEKPGDLPVQQATRVELIINLKTAKALGLTVPLSLLGRADEVIE